MQLEKFTFKAHHTQIEGQYIQPKMVRGVVILVHGFGEHSGRYSETVVPMLTHLELATVQYDNIGHGKSGGKRGHCPSYDALLDILDEVVQLARGRYPNIPMFLYGHSMGGNLVLNYVLRRDIVIAGVVASSPYLRLAFEPPKWKMGLGRLLLNVFSSITLPSGLDPNGISRIPKEVSRYESDDLIHDKVSPMYSFPVIDAGEWAIAHASEFKTDVLLLHGTGDSIIDYRGTEEFHQHCKRSTMKLFNGGFHELHHDLCSAEMLDTVQHWLKSLLH